MVKSLRQSLYLSYRNLVIFIFALSLTSKLMGYDYTLLGYRKPTLENTVYTFTTFDVMTTSYIDSDKKKKEK